MKSLGDEYESKALEFLRTQGMRLITKNFSCKTGEIDIIALDQGHLVFVEVRARNNRLYDSAAGSVDRRKQRRIVHTAQRFLQEHPQLANLPCRFDVVAFEAPQSPSEAPVRWIPGAFTA